jgi:hypothetical protein
MTTTRSFEFGRNVLFALGALLTSALAAQEDCNTSGDDDGDGLYNCAEPVCSGTDPCLLAFPCTQLSKLYQVYDGQQLRIWQNGAWTNTGATPLTGSNRINAMGYNVRDGFIYGMASPSVNHLMQVKSDGFHDQGVVSGMSTSPLPSGQGFNVGDFKDNLLYISNKDHTKMYRIDVSTNTLVDDITIHPNGSSTPEEIDMLDMAYSPNDDLFIGMRSTENPNELRRLQPDGTALAGIIFYSGPLYNGCVSSGVQNNYGGAWADVNGRIYVYCNYGHFYSIELSATAIAANKHWSSGNLGSGDLLVTDLGDDVAMANNDGAGCPFACGLYQECCELPERSLHVNTPAATTNIVPTAPATPRVKDHAFHFLETTGPNPFNERTTLRYHAPDARIEHAEIALVNMAGEIVRSFAVAPMEDGTLSIEAGLLAPGSYICRLSFDGKDIDTTTLVLLPE